MLAVMESLFIVEVYTVLPCESGLKVWLSINQWWLCAAAFFEDIDGFEDFN